MTPDMLPFAAKLGVPIIANVYARPGSAYYSSGQIAGMHGIVVYAHPLDVIALKHPRDPHARLDEAMAWIVDRAYRKLDALTAQLDRDTVADREAVPFDSTALAEGCDTPSQSV